MCPTPRSRLVQYFLIAIPVVVLLLAAGVGGIQLLIHRGVTEITEVAVREGPGDPVLALIEYVESAEYGLRDRNRAVWALGRLRDARALPILEKHYTGEECDHAGALCQHELRKAIRLCRGGTKRVAGIP